MTKKETFEKRFAERYADADLSNEEAYYEHANQLMDDYENYEQATKNLLDALDGNDVLVQMLTDACTQEDFDPVVWMVEKRGLDLEEAMKNPDYAAVITKAHSRYIESQAEERALDEELRRNLPASLEAIGQCAKEMGLSDEEKNGCVAQMWQLGEDMVKGILPVAVFQLLIKGQQYDLRMAEQAQQKAAHEQELAEAYEKGKREGLNIRIDEHLRQVHSVPVGIEATQTPVSTAPKARRKQKNPFVDADWK